MQGDTMGKLFTRVAAVAAAAGLVVGGAHLVHGRSAVAPSIAQQVVRDGVVAEAVRTDGREVELARAEAATPGTATQPRLAGTPASCTDGAYSLSGYKVPNGITFRYNATGAPASVARYASVAIRNSLVAVSTGANRCKLPATLKTTGTYAGATTRTAQLNSSGACVGNDGANTISWGTLPSGYLAITCIYFVAGKVVNADVMISKRYNWFLSRPAGCTNSYDLQSVLTHEQGHTFGLSHVDANAHGSETMGTLINPCDTSKRALGRGDYGALVRLYGTK
jgi:matrixin